MRAGSPWQGTLSRHLLCGLRPAALRSLLAGLVIGASLLAGHLIGASLLAVYVIGARSRPCLQEGSCWRLQPVAATGLAGEVGWGLAIGCLAAGPGSVHAGIGAQEDMRACSSVLEESRQVQWGHARRPARIRLQRRTHAAIRRLCMDHEIAESRVYLRNAG